MKKFISLMLALTLAGVLFVGCTTEEEPTEETTEVEEEVEETEEEETETAEVGPIAKVGLGQNISIGSSKDKAADQNARAQADVTMAAVGFDADGKIASVTVDVTQARVDYDENMEVTSDTEAEVLSKKDLKEDYNMKGASEIGKEWYEQMEAFEDWMIGKTAEEVLALPVKERDESHQSVPDVAELTSSVTITVESYQAAVAEAWENAVDAEGAESLGLGVQTVIDGSKTTGETAQANTTMSATAVDADGNIVASIVDVAQVKISFDEEGLVTNRDDEFKTKHELKEDYNMVGASEIGKEWFEQMNAFQDWMVGKTKEEVVDLPVKERDASHQSVPDVAELTSSVTITVESYQAVVAEAIDNAR